jgi:hypothetical protein
MPSYRTVVYTSLYSGILACSAGGSGLNTSGSGGTGASGGSGGAGAVVNAGTGNVVPVPTAGSSTVDPGACGAGTTTSVHGTVYDPAGKVPLYNVLVYVPVDVNDLPAIPEGPSCDRCAGNPARAIAAALTDAEGRFTIEGVPAGSVPLVIEVGKWRRVVEVPNVAACEQNEISDTELTRLPRNQAEGHIPRIGMVTGHSDALECLLRKIGIDDSEFTTDTGDGRVHMFYGCPQDSDDGSRTGANRFAPELGGSNFSRAATTLYADPAKLDSYDMLILSCEGHSCDDEKLPYVENMKAYGDKGGRILFDHMHFRWLVKSDNAWESVGSFSSGDDFPSPFTFEVDSTFAKGSAFADWLVNVGASSTRGKLDILAAQYSAQSAIAPLAQRWVYTDSPEAVQYMTINTPIENAGMPDAECGRLVHTDLHVSAGTGTDSSDQDTPFPLGCSTTDLSPQEKALEFILFDLSSCVQEEGLEPTVPPIIR